MARQTSVKHVLPAQVLYVMSLRGNATTEAISCLKNIIGIATLQELRRMQDDPDKLSAMAAADCDIVFKHIKTKDFYEN